MAADVTIPESCDTQHSPDGTPSAEWAFEQLIAHAQRQHASIAEAEKPLAVLYWRLGKTLEMARSKYKHGSWGKFLESLGIEKTRVSKARAIFKTFPDETDVAGMSADRAYQQRKRKKRSSKQNDTASRSGPAVIRLFLRPFVIELEDLYDVVAHLSPAEAKEVAPDMDSSLRKFEGLCELLQARLHAES